MHETRARAWCTGKTQRDRVEREVGGGRWDGEYKGKKKDVGDRTWHIISTHLMVLIIFDKYAVSY